MSYGDRRPRNEETAAARERAGLALKILLALTGLSQAKLHEASGIDRGQISDYCNGKDPIPDKNRAKILRVLRVSPSMWGVAEETALRFLAARKRFAEVGTADTPYEEDEAAPGSEVRDTLSVFAALDARTADDISSWVGVSVAETLRGVFQRLRDRRP